MAKVWRQGDVIVRSLTEEEYEELKARSWPSNNPVITGENGHAHVIEADEVSETWDRARGIRVFVVMAVKAVMIRHEEHPDLVLPPGYYEIHQAREWLPGRIRAGGD